MMEGFSSCETLCLRTSPHEQQRQFGRRQTLSLDTVGVCHFDAPSRAQITSYATVRLRIL